MTPAEELAQAADKLDALASGATAGPWTAEAASSISVLPGGQAIEFTTWLVISPVPDEENQQTSVVAAERNARDGSLTGGCYDQDDAAYIAAMNPLVGKALAEWLYDQSSAAAVRRGHSAWALKIARLINGGAS
jgi:hypothetical protein